MYLNFGFLVAAAVILVALWVRDVIRPGSFDRRKPKRDLMGLPTPAWFGCAAIVWLTPQVAVVVASGLMQRRAGGSSLGDQGLLMLIAYGVGIGACVLMGYLVSPRVPKAGLRLARKDALLGAGALAITLPILQSASLLGVVVYHWITGESPGALAHRTLRDIASDPRNPWVWAAIGVAVIGAPIVEEFTYRLFLQSGISRATRSSWTGILISAGVFALVHRMADKPENAVPWHMIPTLFIFGVAMGVALERTGKILAPITMHVLFNAISITLVMTGMVG